MSACDAIKHAVSSVGIRRLAGGPWFSSAPRRSVRVAPTARSSVLDMVTVWAAVQGVAAWLAGFRAGVEQLRALPTRSKAFDNTQLARLTERKRGNFPAATAGRCRLGPVFASRAAQRAGGGGQPNRLTGHLSGVGAWTMHKRRLAVGRSRRHGTAQQGM